MALPTLETPTYTLSLPSNPKSKIAFRPFLVAEEKILMMAQESADPVEMMTAMKNVIRGCTFGKLDPDTMTTFDLEFVFLRLRTKSVGETSKVIFKCTKCDAPIEVVIELENIEVKFDTAATKTIMLSDNIGVTLRYLDVNDMVRLSDSSLPKDEAITLALIASIDTIFDGTSVHLRSQTSDAELVSFVNSMRREQVSKIEEFLANAPRLTHDVKCKCQKCGLSEVRTIQGLQSFFG